MPELSANDVTLAYDGPVVVHDLSVGIPDRRITAIIGPNGCGKSTLLRALARLLKPQSGAVILDGEEITKRSTREVALRLGLLPQSPLAPEGLTVEDLVARGRFPHQRWFRQWSVEDAATVNRSLELAQVVELRDRPVESLSGGQRQRVWIAMALAQDVPIMLLDEPTTYLDLAHRLDVLDLLAELNETQRRTVVMVVHDINEACRYAHHVIAMRDGRIVCEGAPSDVITAERVEAVFELPCQIAADPVTSTPLVIPLHRADRRARTLELAGMSK